MPLKIGGLDLSSQPGAQEGLALKSTRDAFCDLPTHDRVRKSMKRNLLASSFAIVVGIPLGWILAMMSTPILWRLEPFLHMELAGHSGPSDWVFYVAWAVVLPAFFFLFRFSLFRAVAPKMPHS